ncbi:MAG: hypothetical protein Tsb0020_03730 [Haliangiales bacterium]
MQAPPSAQSHDYQLGRHIATGAMCDVYEALLSTGQTVAIKMLHACWCGNDEVQARFHNEVDALMQIDDSGVISAHGRGLTSDDRPYVILEWLPWDLARLMKQTNIAPSPAEAHQVVTQVAAVMSRLHARNIIHRDLKPANILLSSMNLDSAEIKLADLGLAKLTNSSEHAGQLAHVSTANNHAFGTWDYMAPEQWMDVKTVGPAADVYALGVIWFQMLAQKLPFVAEDERSLMCLHLFEPPPLDLLAPPGATPNTQALWRARIAQMLSKTPTERPTMSTIAAWR